MKNSKFMKFLKDDLKFKILLKDTKFPEIYKKKLRKIKNFS